MTKIPDFTGKTFGRLTVLYQVEDIKGKDGYNHNAWMCECSCENLQNELEDEEYTDW